MPVILLLVLFGLLHQQIQPVQANSTFSLALPLAVRSPYLSCWLPQTNGSNETSFSSDASTRYNLTQQEPLRVIVRVDGNVYSMLKPFQASVNGTNRPLGSINNTNRIVTPTRITFTGEAGPMQVNLTFVNPVEPGNWVKQSTPFSYLSLTASSLDNLTHSMQVYSAITGSWIPEDSYVYRSITSNTDAIYHNITFSEPVVFSETDNLPGWGTLYFAMKNDGHVTYTAYDLGDSDAPDPLTSFFYSGLLNNTGGEGVYPSWASFITFSISRDLGSIRTTQAPVVWAIGLTTDPAINYPVQSSSSSRNARSPYYKLKYADDGSLIVDFLNDFDNALTRAQNLDQKILQDAASVSDLLGDLISLAVPQVFGSTQLTIGTNSDGKFNESDVMLFVKNVGWRQGLSGRINAVETLYAAFPALMYIDPTLGTPLLEPLFQLQPLADYDVRFAAPDIGSNYPNVTISQPKPNLGVEETGNMLIMTYANARTNGDGSLISRYYSVLTSWADYLSNASLNAAYQKDADFLGTMGDTYTNLAIKGVIAIEAMSKMCTASGNIADAYKYSNISANLYTEWKKMALSPDQHLLMYLGDTNLTNLWTSGYNLFADMWLSTNVVESSVYDGQSNFLTNQLDNFGLPVGPQDFGDDDFIASSSWNLFVAAMTPDINLRSNIIRSVHNRASIFGNQSLGAFPLRYNAIDGSDFSTEPGIGSPAQGAMFAPLYGKIPVRDIRFNTTTTTTPPTKTSTPPLHTSTSSSKLPHTDMVARGLIGAVTALVVLAVILAMFIWYRRRLNTHKSSASSNQAMESASGIVVTPFIPAFPDHFGMTHEPQSDLVPWTVAADADTYDPFSLQLPSIPRSKSLPSVPVGLPAKELVRIRAETLHPRPAAATPVLGENHESGSQSGRSPSPPSSPVSAPERGTTTSPPMSRMFQSQFDRLWREVQQLRAERVGSEAPPSYAEREMSHSHHSGGMRS